MTSYDVHFKTGGKVIQSVDSWVHLGHVINNRLLDSDDVSSSYTHTHNRFTAGLEYVRVHPGQQVPKR